MKETRPGTKATDRIVGWDHVSGRHPRYKTICSSDREQKRWEESLNAASEALELAALRCRIAMLMTHGGHVERGAMARAGISPDADPEAVLGLCVRGLPTDLPDKAMLKK